MNISDAIKATVTAQQVAERYGLRPNRAGFIKCPFHSGDKHGSLKLYPGSGGWHCFGCGKGSTVIDFVMQMESCSFRDAVVRMNEDFNLGLTDERAMNRTVSEAAKRLQEHREKINAVRKARENVMARMWKVRNWLEKNEPKRPDDPVPELLNRAYTVRDRLEGELDELDEKMWALEHGTE